jgi:phage terminase small subunit
MAGPLKNPKHERFVQALIKGETLAAAYVTAGFKPNEKNAARLKKVEGVAARLAELQERVAEKAVITAADIAAQLDEDRAFARELKQASAAVSASLGKAKVLGLIVNRIGGPDGGPIEYRDLSEEEIEARIAARMAELNGDKGD